MCPMNVFCPAGDRAWMDTEDEHGLSDSQARCGRFNKGVIKNMERGAAKCRHLLRRKSLLKDPKSQREWEGRLEQGALSKRQSDQQVRGQKVLYQPQELAKMGKEGRMKCELTASEVTPMLWKLRRCKPKGFGSRRVGEKV